MAREKEGQIKAGIPLRLQQGAGCPLQPHISVGGLEPCDSISLQYCARYYGFHLLSLMVLEGLSCAAHGTAHALLSSLSHAVLVT